MEPYNTYASVAKVIEGQLQDLLNSINSLPNKDAKMQLFQRRIGRVMLDWMDIAIDLHLEGVYDDIHRKEDENA